MEEGREGRWKCRERGREDGGRSERRKKGWRRIWKERKGNKENGSWKKGKERCYGEYGRVKGQAEGKGRFGKE